MDYNLGIGNLEVNIKEEGIESYIDLIYKGEKHDNAPAFGEPTDFTNSRWPSYTSWHNFTVFVGLEDLFHNEETGILREHPGIVPFVKEHKDIIDKAYSEFYKKYPNYKAGYSPKIKDNFRDKDENWPEENDWATRLEWLEYWVDWALRTCDKPVFYNS